MNSTATEICNSRPGYNLDADGNPLRRTQAVQPFQDDFNDGNLTGWSVIGTWSASTHAARNTVNGGAHSYLYKSTSDADTEIRFDYVTHDTSNSAYGLTVIPRINTAGHQLFINFLPDRMQVLEKVNGTWHTLVNNYGAPTAQDTVYTALGASFNPPWRVKAAFGMGEQPQGRGRP